MSAALCLPSQPVLRLLRIVCLPLLLCLLVLAQGCSMSRGGEGLDQPGGGNVSGVKISKTALTAIGTRYKYGGSSPSSGFDCSGLVCWSYGKYGIKLPRTAREQSKIGSSVSRSSLRPGDIVAFKISSGMHTGIYTGGGKFVHSPSSGKTVRQDSISSKYWKTRFYTARRHKSLK